MPTTARRAGQPGRAVGLLLLLFAVLTAVVVPRFDGTPTGGSAVAAPIDPPPRIGSCVTHFDLPSALTDPGADGVLVPSAAYGSCGGAIAGEVLSVRIANGPLGALSAAAYDSASTACAQGVDAYLGAPSGLDAGPPSTRWLPAARYNTLLVGPDARQRAAGRNWSACVVTSVASSTYTPPVRNAFDAGDLADQFGYCLRSTDLSDWLPCSTPHSAQVLAWGMAAGAGVAPVRADCLAAAAALMRTSDPTRGGALDVGLIGYEGAGSVQACGVRVNGSRRLTGSVVDIGNGPLPWTG